ncbi:MAG: tetratricopeptide repeat protein [Candidatus Hodarchaeota archaeon]
MANEWQNEIIKLAKRGDIKDAITFATKVAENIGIHDEIAEFLDEIGTHLGKNMEKHEQALCFFEAAIRLAKNEKIKEKAAMNCCVAHTILGNILVKNNKSNESEMHFREALKINPSFSWAHSEYAYLLNLMERSEEAETHFIEALELDPENSQAHINYAILLDKLGRSDEAIFHCEEALRINPNNPLYHVTTGIVLYNRQIFAESESHFKVALESNRELIPANYFYGKLLIKLGRFGEAKIFFEKTIALNPNFLDVQKDFQYAVFMDSAAHPRRKISKEWLDARRHFFEWAKRDDLKDFEMMKKHQKEWKILYDKFSCERCGKCCKRTKWATDIDTRLVWEDIERWRREGREDILQYVYVFEDLGGDIFDKTNFRRLSKCPFFKKKGKISSCSIHETKPLCCGIFPFYFNYQGICPNCGASLYEDDLYCEECNLFLKAHPGAINCPGMIRTLKSLDLYREVYHPILDLFRLTFRKR